MISDLPELARLPFCVPVTTVTLQLFFSGIQFFAYRVSSIGIAIGETAFLFVV